MTMSGLDENSKILVEHSKTVEQVIKCILTLIEAGRDSLPQLRDDSKIKDYLDSFNLIRLVTLLENDLGVLFEYSDLNESNWATPSAVADMVSQKRKDAEQSSPQ